MWSFWWRGHLLMKEQGMIVMHLRFIHRFLRSIQSSHSHSISWPDRKTRHPVSRKHSNMQIRWWFLILETGMGILNGARVFSEESRSRRRLLIWKKLPKCFRMMLLFRSFLQIFTLKSSFTKKRLPIFGMRSGQIRMILSFT